MRNPLRSEAEAFNFLVIVLGGAVLVGAAAYLDTWVGVAAALLVIAAIAIWLRGGHRIPAPAITSSTPGDTHRVLVVAPPGTSSLAGRLEPGMTEILVVVPALASAVEALTGAVDERRADAERTADALAAELSRTGARARAVVGADDTVILLGKGHEKTIERADGEHPWNEMDETRQALHAIKKTT